MEKKTTTKKTMSFIDKLISIQSELKAPKNQFNSFGKYKYRSLEDIQEAIKPLLTKHKLVMNFNDEIKEIGGVLFVESSCILSDGKAEQITKAQAGIDPSKKGMDLSQCFGSSSSYARKYSAGAMFLIDDTKDADATNKHDKTPTPVQKAPVKKSLNDNQFIRLMGAINNGKMTVDKAIKDFALTSKQITDLKNMKQ
jgi:hypothetical protein